MAISPSHPDSFGARGTLDIDGRSLEYFSLAAPGLDQDAVAKLPFSIKILLENLLRHEDGRKVTADDIRALAAPVLRHRMALGFAARADGITLAQVIETLLGQMD